MTDEELFDAIQALPRTAFGFHECHHRRVEIRRKTAANGRPMIGKQCLLCGRIADGKWMGKSTPFVCDWDEELPSRFTTTVDAIRSAEQEQQRDQESDAWWTMYNAHINSQAWRDLRTKVIDREGGLCQGCRVVRGTQVHHMTYDRLGNELLTDLVLFCDSCHDRYHAKPVDTRATVRGAAAVLRAIDRGRP